MKIDLILDDLNQVYRGTVRGFLLNQIKELEDALKGPYEFDREQIIAKIAIIMLKESLDCKLSIDEVLAHIELFRRKNMIKITETKHINKETLAKIVKVCEVK